VAIILLTVLFKAVLSPLQIMQINSMVKMRRLQPKLQEIQERHKNDRQKLGMEMMQLYSKEKFNPFAGCFPMIPQIPIFLAMFWVTREAFEFRGESFLWIPDLAESDPFLITPILMGVMMYASQKNDAETPTVFSRNAGPNCTTNDGGFSTNDNYNFPLYAGWGCYLFGCKFNPFNSASGDHYGQNRINLWCLR